MPEITAEFRESALRRGIIVKPVAADDTPATITYAAVIELANLGFMATPADLTGMSVNALTDLIDDARTVIGADRAMKPVYPGFPRQVEELSTMTLIVEQLLHYWTAGAFLPDYPDVVRGALPLEDVLRNARHLRALSASETAREFMIDLVTDPVAMSADDRALLRGSLDLVTPDRALVEHIVTSTRSGENLQAFVEFVNDLDEFSTDVLFALVAPHTSNPDHLLRVILTLMSNPSAPQHQSNYFQAVETLADSVCRAVRMNKMSRATRRIIINRLGDITGGFRADALVSRQQLWRRVMRAVHPYDFTLTEAQQRAADIIHSNMEHRTFNSLVEEAIQQRDVVTAVELLSKHQPGNLLRRAVALLRLVTSDRGAKVLASAVESTGARSTVTTLISAYNGIISANDDHTRVNRVAGLTNTMLDRGDVVKVDDAHLSQVADAVKRALTTLLMQAKAPTGPVAVNGAVAVPLVRRDASTTDRVMDRGEQLAIAGAGDVLRIFGHWNNNQSNSGYMDIGVIILDGDFQQIAVSTWNSWSAARSWSTYSGDQCVSPRDSAAEFIDVKLDELRHQLPAAKWAAMTVQSWCGWPMNEVDFIAGAMLRSDADKGEVFDARSVSSAFKPTTSATQAVPFVVNLDTGALVWIDSSNGSTALGQSATDDSSVGSIVYDELVRPRLTFGDLARLWARAHGVETVDEPVDRDLLLSLL